MHLLPLFKPFRVLKKPFSWTPFIGALTHTVIMLVSGALFHATFRSVVEATLSEDYSQGLENSEIRCW